MRPVVVLGCLVLTGCWRSTRPPPPISNSVHEEVTPGLFSLSPDGVGPLTADTHLTLSGLRAAFVGYEVRAENDPDLSYNVYDRGKKLLWIIPNADGTVFNVHATDPRSMVSTRGWRVGEAFRGASELTTCECWGENPTCYRKGEHVAVNFDRHCLEGTDRRAFKVLDGVVIQRVIWSPAPFGSDADKPTDDLPDADDWVDPPTGP